jgi:ribonuclease HI
VAAQHDVIRLEQQLLDPTYRGNAEFLAAVLHPDFVEYGKSGRVWTRDLVIAALAADPAVSGDAHDFHADQLSADVVLLTFRTTGALRSSIWVRDAGNWRMRFHQGTTSA